MTLDLYVDIRSQTLIQSHRNGGKFVVPRQYREQVIPIRVFYVTPNATGGAANPYTIGDASAYTSVRVGIGGFANALAVSSGLAWNPVDSCWDGGWINLNTVELNAALDAASGGEMTSIFETEAYVVGSLIKTQDSVVLKRTVLTSGGGLPTPVTITVFVDRLETALADSDTLTWRRVVDEMFGDVPIFGAPTVFGDLSVSSTQPDALLEVVSDAGVVGGLAGERYLIRARFSGTFDEHVFTVGVQKPGDDGHIIRNGGTVSPTVADLWYLDISSPAQRIYLNHGVAAPPTDFDFDVCYVADAGASVTLTFASDNAGGAGQYVGNLVFKSASEVLGPHVIHRSSVAASAHTGNTTETTKATVAIAPLGANSQIRIAATFSRPATQADDAFLLARLNGTLLWRQRVGALRGGSVDVVVLANRADQGVQLLSFDTEADWLVGTAAINTTAATSLTLSVQLANAADSITLESLTVIRENP